MIADLIHYISVEKGCFVTGLYLEGARWSNEKNELERSIPKVLVEPLPILAVIPIEVHRLRLQVLLTTNLRSRFCEHTCIFSEHIPCSGVHNFTASQCDGRGSRFSGRFAHGAAH